MKTKLEMAHDYLLKTMKDTAFVDESDICFFVDTAWKYADAMQVKADKQNKEESAQKRKAIREMLNADNTFLEKEGQHFDDVEWQPDWSQAPEWAVAWTIDSAECLWWSYIPWFKNNFWFVDDSISWKCDDAPNFGYKGDWRDSLRKRPQ